MRLFFVTSSSRSTGISASKDDGAPKFINSYTDFERTRSNTGAFPDYPFHAIVRKKGDKP